MAYTIDRYNRTVLTVVEDGTLDQTTDIKLVGKNYAGYGEIQNENFVYLLENFAGSTAPPKAISGQIWFDSSASKLKFYDGTKWRTTGGAEVLATAPSGLTEGDFWWDTNNEQLYAYNGSDFVLVGPQDAGDGVTQMQSRSIRDTQAVNHSVIVSVVNDTVVHVISNDEFTIDSSDAENRIPGFDIIKKGITLINTLASTNGVTSTEHLFWGTASNAKKLNGIDASAYVTSAPGQPTVFSNLVEFADEGYALGDSNDLRCFIENDNEAVLQNTASKITLKSITLNTADTNRPSDTPGSFSIKSNSFEPGFTADGVTLSTVDLGADTARFNRVYASNFIGTSEKASALVVNGNSRAGDTATTANTVAVRDASGDIRANLFRGTALTAKFADLAEKYITSGELEPGTVVAVCDEEHIEVAPTSIGDIAMGVVSTAPALIMNEDLEDGQAIALKGRVPVRVTGPVKKGQAVYVHEDGCASTAINGGSIVGIALESDAHEEEKLVECVLKV
jgi:hypothetical protein